MRAAVVLGVGIGAAACGSGSGTAVRGPASADTGPAGAAAAPSTTIARQPWHSSGVHIVSTPEAGDGVVLGVDGTTADLEVVALDITTGAELWREPWSPSGMFGGMGVGSPAIVGRTAVLVQVVGNTTELVGVDTHTGSHRWSYPVGSTFAPFACGHLVCAEVQPSATSSAGVIALDADTGAVRWTFGGEVDFVVAKGDVLIELRLGHPGLVSLDPSSGVVRWSVDLGKAIGAGSDTSGGWGGNLVGSSLVGYVGQPDPTAPGANPNAPGAVFSVDAATGAIHWLRRNMELCQLPTADVVLICGAHGGIRRLDPATGKDLWVVNDWASVTGLGPWMGMSSDLKVLVGKTRSGSPATIGIDTGTAATSTKPAWVVVVGQTDGRVAPGVATDKYLSLIDPVPWNVAAGRPASTAGLRAGDVPSGVGQSSGGYQTFVDGSGNLVGLPN